MQTFGEKLRLVLNPKTQLDRTTFRKVANFLANGIRDKKFTPQVYDIVLGFAAEAIGPKSRNPRAVFMSILKDELNYGPKKTRD